MPSGSRIPAISAHARRLQRPALRLSQSRLTVTASILVLPLSVLQGAPRSCYTIAPVSIGGHALTSPSARIVGMGCQDGRMDCRGRLRQRVPLSRPEADRVFYAGSFSKVLSPGLRLGYLVVPSSELNRFSRDTELFAPI